MARNMELNPLYCRYLMVGETGFEPATPWSQTRCATSLRHSPTSLRLRTLGRLGKRRDVA